MKTNWVIITAAILAVVLAAGCTAYQQPEQQPPATGTEKTVQITAEGFSPARVEINSGDMVTWVSMDTAAHRPASAVHPTHTVYPETGGCIGSKFDACKNLTQGESFTFTFNHAGEWKYHDHLNCCTNPAFFGTVAVK